MTTEGNGQPSVYKVDYSRAIKKTVHAVVAPVAVGYAVHEHKPLVFIRSISLLG